MNIYEGSAGAIRAELNIILSENIYAQRPIYDLEYISQNKIEISIEILPPLVRTLKNTNLFFRFFFYNKYSFILH